MLDDFETILVRILSGKIEQNYVTARPFYFASP